MHLFFTISFFFKTNSQPLSLIQWNEHVELNKFSCSLSCTWMTIIDSIFLCFWQLVLRCFIGVYCSIGNWLLRGCKKHTKHTYTYKGLAESPWGYATRHFLWRVPLAHFLILNTCKLHERIRKWWQERWVPFLNCSELSASSLYSHVYVRRYTRVSVL